VAAGIALHLRPQLFLWIQVNQERLAETGARLAGDQEVLFRCLTPEQCGLCASGEAIGANENGRRTRWALARVRLH